MTIKTKIKRIIEKIAPFSIISTNNKTAAIPSYINHIYIDLILKNKRYVFFKKIKNSYKDNKEFNQIQAKRIMKEVS